MCADWNVKENPQNMANENKAQAGDMIKIKKTPKKTVYPLMQWNVT